jgi:nucleoside-diphosphate-sugar epimerase
VGSHLADKLKASGFEVMCLKRKTSSTKWLDGKGFEYIEGDLFSNEALEYAVAKADYVFHVAGVVKSVNKEGFYRGNHEATKNLLEITKKVNPGIKKFVHISSQAACGPAIGIDAVDENTQPNPITTYGESKLMAENEVNRYAAEFPVSIVRPPAVFGPRDTEILIYFQTFSKGLNSVIGFDKKYLSLIYVEDLIDGIMLVAKEEIANGRTYFVCLDEPYNWDEIGHVTSKLLGKKALKVRIPHSIVYSVGFIAETIASFSGKAATLNVEKCKDITQLRWVCSNGKAKRELGFSNRYTLEESFGKTIEWYKELKWIQ